MLPCPSWWSVILAERGRAKAAGVLNKMLGSSPSCQVDASGVVPCSPEDMRKRTESQIKTLGLRPASWTLPLDVYSIARNIRSEAGIGQKEIPIKVVYAESAIIRARTDKGSISKLTMKNSSRYGKQSGSNPSVATSKDPTWDDIVIAEMALSGQLGNFARGTTHYFSPRIMDVWSAQGKSKSALQTFETWSHGWGSTRDRWIWVGDLPGIDHREHFLMRKIAVTDPAWLPGYAAGKAVIQAKSHSSTSFCPGPIRAAVTDVARAVGSRGLVGLGVGLGIGVGLLVLDVVPRRR